MKKIILIIPILILTGCLGKSGKGYITKKCEKLENINGKVVKTNIEITSKQGDIETIKITQQYDKNMDIDKIIMSKKSEQNLYKSLDGIQLDINENIFTYNIQTNNINEDLKERFNIKKEQHKQIKYYEENGYTCK